MKSIPLTQGKITLVDDEDYPELSKYRWYALRDGNTYYALRNSRDPVKHKRIHIRMHASILGTLKGMDSDHINGDGLDNRRANLRIATRRQNSQNLHVEKSSTFPGVTWKSRRQKWLAQIRFNGKKRYLGLYDDEQMAATVYAVACKALGV